MSELHHRLIPARRTIWRSLLLLWLAPSLALGSHNTNMPLTDAMAMLAHGSKVESRESAPVSNAVAEVTQAADGAKKAFEMPPFEYYEVIITRQPFGALSAAKGIAVEPPDADEMRQAQEEQKLARQIHMVAVNRTPAGRIAVGFVDKAAKPEKHYYLNVGESADGFTVVEASFQDESATLTKEEVTITLKLGQGLVSGGAPAAELPRGAGRQAALPVAIAARSPALPTPPVRPPVTAPAVVPSTPPAAARAVSAESFRERLTRQRAEREAAEAARQQRAALDVEAAAQKITKEELEKQTREINLNLIRQGMRPISPITLTPEEDAEMVRLGVLDDS